LLTIDFRPAVADVNKIISLFDAGMSVARFNMSHGNQKVSF
jgi:pyruvate kinase